MTNNERAEAIAHLRLAIELAGNGRITPFTDEEYELMYQLLDEMSSDDEKTNDTVVVVSEDDVDNFFADDYVDYKKIVGKCFINEEIGVAVKILEIPNDEYHEIEPYEFIYEMCENCIDGWNFEDYNWLQEHTDAYEKYKITPYANMNIASENMFHLGKNGKLYTTVECGDEWYEYHEISNEEFEKIREEAINNLEE
jgi:hypothetical protein